MNKPNVVFFMVDQLAAKWVEAAEMGICDLPNLRRLTEGGVTFTRAISSNPVCCPARATLATGQSCRGHGVVENGYRLDPALPTFMRSLQQGGWRTGAFGKVHLRPHFEGVYPDYRQYGFDVTHVTEDDRGGEWLDWVQQNHPQHFEAVLATVWATQIADFAAHGPSKQNLRERIKAIREKFDWATPEFPLNDGGAYTLPFPEEVSQTNWITAMALDFLADTPADQPLMAHVSYVQPHRPFCPPAEYMQNVDADRIPEPIPAEWVDDPHGPSELKRRQPIMPANWRYHRHCYFADMTHLDRQLGRILDALETSGRLDNTYIIFLSDHGELLYDHGLVAKGEKHYDASVRIPLVVAGPGVQHGAVCENFVQLEDICPTVLEMAGQALPPLPKAGPYLPVAAEDIDRYAGRSLLGLCRGEQPENWRQSAYVESYNNLESLDTSQWARTIRTERFRYTFYPSGGGEQMFDLQSDPDELNNLVADPAFAVEREQLRVQLLERVILQDYPRTRRDLFALGVH